MNLPVKRTLISLLLAFVLCMLGACGGQEDAVTAVMPEDELIRIGEESCTLAEAMIFVAAQKNIYQDSYGGDIWSVQLESGTFEDYIMDGLKSYLGKLFAAAQMAKLEGHTLSDSETEKVEAAASAYMAAMSEAEIQATHLNRDIVRDAYEQYVLALTMYEDVLKKERVEVSEDEARVIRLQQIWIASEPGNAEKRAKAEEAWQALQDGSAFASVQGQYNESAEGELEVMRGELPADQEKLAFSLASGEVSELTAVEGGYVIFSCLTSYDETASKANQARLLAERQDSVFSQYLTAFLQDHKATFNDRAWEQVSISGYEGAASANFYLIYREYFAEETT